MKRVNGIAQQNQAQFVFATDVGLYATSYMYELNNDLTRFDDGKVNGILADMLQESIPTALDGLVGEHVRAMHGDDSVIGVVNSRIEDVDFTSIPDGWMNKEEAASETAISNDILDDVVFGTQDDRTISVFTSNFVKDDTPGFSYVEKRYRSGLTELYMLLDTTNTYYVNHVPGAGRTTVPTASESGYPRKNLERFGASKSRISYDPTKDSLVDKCKTGISVVLGPTYDVRRVTQYEVNGCSLPLKVYLDVDGQSVRSPGQLSGMY